MTAFPNYEIAAAKLGQTYVKPVKYERFDEWNTNRCRYCSQDPIQNSIVRVICTWASSRALSGSENDMKTLSATVAIECVCVHEPTFRTAGASVLCSVPSLMERPVDKTITCNG